MTIYDVTEERACIPSHIISVVEDVHDITRPVTAIKSPGFALLYQQTMTVSLILISLEIQWWSIAFRSVIPARGYNVDIYKHRDLACHL